MQIFIKSASKTTYSYSARRVLSIGAWFDHIRKKKFWSIFLVRVPPLVKKSQKNFFFKYGQITHQSIDLVELSKTMWFWGALIHTWVICVQNSVFEVPVKFNPIIHSISPCFWDQISPFNIFLYSLFIAESESFFQIEFRLFFYEIFKF